MVPIYSVVMFSVLAAAAAQRSPYQGSSDPGVLPQYLPEGTDNRFGEDKSQPEYGTQHQMHNGTLNTEELYNRVTEWPEDRKPFWYLNANAIQAQREREQMQQAQAAQQAQMNQPSPFSSSSSSGSRPGSDFSAGSRFGSGISSGSRPGSDMPRRPSDRPFRRPYRE